MEWKLIDVILPRMEDKPKSLNTQRDKWPLIKLKNSWITKELRRITLAKKEEIKFLYFLNKNQLDFIDKNDSAYIGALTIRITKDPLIFNYNPLKVINDPFKLIMIHYWIADCNWIDDCTEFKATKSYPQAFNKGPLGLPKFGS